MIDTAYNIFKRRELPPIKPSWPATQYLRAIKLIDPVPWKHDELA